MRQKTSTAHHWGPKSVWPWWQHPFRLFSHSILHEALRYGNILLSETSPATNKTAFCRICAICSGSRFQNHRWSVCHSIIVGSHGDLEPIFRGAKKERFAKLTRGAKGTPVNFPSMKFGLKCVASFSVQNLDSHPTFMSNISHTGAQHSRWLARRLRPRWRWWLSIFFSVSVRLASSLQFVGEALCPKHTWLWECKRTTPAVFKIMALFTETRFPCHKVCCSTRQQDQVTHDEQGPATLKNSDRPADFLLIVVNAWVTEATDRQTARISWKWGGSARKSSPLAVQLPPQTAWKIHRNLKTHGTKRPLFPAWPLLLVLVCGGVTYQQNSSTWYCWHLFGWRSQAMCNVGRNQWKSQNAPLRCHSNYDSHLRRYRLQNRGFRFLNLTAHALSQHWQAFLLIFSRRYDGSTASCRRRLY